MIIHLSNDLTNDSAFSFLAFWAASAFDGFPQLRGCTIHSSLQGPARNCIQDERRGCAGERGEAKEACGQEHDGDAGSYGGILELAQNLLNISNVYIARSRLSARCFRIYGREHYG